MAPFVPDFISDELNLVVALLLGIAFGIVLEQAGFSSSRRLAGVFYGYDFTVLRVFFTAGMTAMAGVIILGAAGWLDLNAIYINPTFWWPALVGGAIMGVGFIIGGYCPGTSIAAAAIGKIDAMVFVLGGILGVFLFGELFPLYDAFFVSDNAGSPQVFASLGIPEGIFVFALFAVAIAAFTITTRIERAVNPQSPSRSWSRTRHGLAAVLLAGIGLAIVFLPDRHSALLREVQDPVYQQEHPVKGMCADELAFHVLDADPRIVIIDVRTPESFGRFALPHAHNISLDGLFDRHNTPLLGMRQKQRVFVDEDGVTGRTAALLALRLGFENARYLEGGMRVFQDSILQFKPPTSPPPRELADTYRFRAKASTMIPQLVRESAAEHRLPVTVTKKVAGGC